MSRPFRPDEAADAQTLEDILRLMNLDQFPRFPSTMEHIAQHFVNLHPDERRAVLGWLREVIRTTSLAAQLRPLSPTTRSWKRKLKEDYARLANSDPSFLPMFFEIERWCPEADGSEGNSALEDLHYFFEFMLLFKEARILMAKGSLDLVSGASGEAASAPEDVDDQIRDISRFVIYLYGFNNYPRPSVNNAIRRIRHVNLAFSIEKEARAVLNPVEFGYYDSVLKESTEAIFKYGYSKYDKDKSLDTLGKLYDIAEPHEPLKRLVMEIPWYHLHQESEGSTSNQ